MLSLHDRASRRYGKWSEVVILKNFNVRSTLRERVFPFAGIMPRHRGRLASFESHFTRERVPTRLDPTVQCSTLLDPQSTRLTATSTILLLIRHVYAEWSHAPEREQSCHLFSPVLSILTCWRRPNERQYGHQLSTPTVVSGSSDASRTCTER